MGNCVCCKNKDVARHSRSLPPIQAMTLYTPPVPASAIGEIDAQTLDIATLGGVSCVADVKTANDVPFHLEKYKQAKKDFSMVKTGPETGTHATFERKASYLCLDDGTVPDTVPYRRKCRSGLL